MTSTATENVPRGRLRTDRQWRARAVALLLQEFSGDMEFSRRLTALYEELRPDLRAMAGAFSASAETPVLEGALAVRRHLVWPEFSQLETLAVMHRQWRRAEDERRGREGWTWVRHTFTLSNSLLAASAHTERLMAFVEEYRQRGWQVGGARDESQSCDVLHFYKAIAPGEQMPVAPCSAVASTLAEPPPLSTPPYADAPVAPYLARLAAFAEETGLTVVPEGIDALHEWLSACATAPEGEELPAFGLLLPALDGGPKKVWVKTRDGYLVEAPSRFYILDRPASTDAPGFAGTLAAVVRSAQGASAQDARPQDTRPELGKHVAWLYLRAVRGMSPEAIAAEHGPALTTGRNVRGRTDEQARRLGIDIKDFARQRTSAAG